MKKTQYDNISKAASKAVSKGMAVRKAATAYGINRITLKQIIEKQNLMKLKMEWLLVTQRQQIHIGF